MNVKTLIESLDLDNSTARSLINEVCKKFGWQHTVFCTEDIIAEIESRGVEATGHMIDAVHATWTWQYLGVVIDAEGYEMLIKAVDEVTGVPFEPTGEPF